ncbi:hypothetical protein HOA56_00130, partial [archaeon]|nr:hypothetical protein [archaeon]
DLIENNEIIKQLISYLLQGNIERPAKYINQIGFQDFCDTLEISCIVGENIRDRFPGLYSYIENIIKNHFKIWVRLFNQGEKETIKYLKKLFTSSALLGSSSTLDYIFYNDQIVQLWLYKKEECFFENIEFTNEFKALTFALTNRNNDFKNTYHKLCNAIEYYSFFPSIVRRLLYIRWQLLESTDFKALLLNYKHFRDESIYLSIGKEDFSFLKKNFDYKRFSITNTCSLILKHHQNKLEAIDFVLTNIESENVDYNKKKIYLKTIVFLENSFSLLINYLKKLILNSSNKELVDICLEVCQNIPIQKLPTEIVEYYRNQIYINVEYVEYYKIDNHQYKFSIPSTYSSVLDSHNAKVIVNNMYKGFIEDSFYFYDFYLVLDFSCCNVESIPKSGILVIDAREYEYYEFQTAKSSRNLIFKVNSKIHSIIKSITRKSEVQITKSKSTLCGIYKDYYKQKMDSTKEVGFIVKMEDGSIHFPDRGIIQIESDTVDIREPLKYHPDLLSESEDILKYLGRYIESSLVKSFLIKTGISHLFTSKLGSRLNIGIILQDPNSANYIKYYSLTYKTINSLKDVYSLYTSIKENEFVIIEDNLRMYTLIDMNLANHFYCESYIAEVNEKKREGFISCEKSKQKYDSDYYFTYDDCDFTPQKMDVVSFLPVVNVSMNYYGYPRAVFITKMKPKICRITYFKSGGIYHYGFAENIKTKENLYFNLPNEGLEYIMDFKGCFVLGQTFHYYKLHDAHDDNLEHIKLLKMLLKYSESKKNGY